MNKSEALSLAVNALSYVLEEDASYLTEEAIAEYSQALEVLSASNGTQLVALSNTSFSVLAGMVAESRDVIASAIFAPEEVWSELRAQFPLDAFKKGVVDMEGADWQTDPPADKPYYWPED